MSDHTVQPHSLVELSDRLRAQAASLCAQAINDRETSDSIQDAIDAGDDVTPDEPQDVAAGLANDADRAEKLADLLVEAADALTRRPQETRPPRRIELTSGMVAQLFAFAGQDPEPMPEDQSELTIEYSEAGHSGAGYYAHFTDVPEGGAVLLDGVNPPRFGEPDDEPSSLPTIDPPSGPCAECESGECEATASAPAEPFLVPALEEGTPIPVHTEHGYHQAGMDTCPICEEQNNAAKVRAIGEKSFIVTGLTTAQLVQKLVEIGRGVDTLNLLQASLSGYGVKPVFSPYWFELTADGQVSLARVANAEWPDWARDAADRFMFNTNQDHVEIARLRMQAERHMAQLADASRLLWAVLRCAGTPVRISGNVLANTNWERTAVKTHRHPDSFDTTYTAVLLDDPAVES